MQSVWSICASVAKMPTSDIVVSEFKIHSCNYIQFRVCRGGVMVKTMDCGIVVSGFEFQLRYYVNFRMNILRKGMKPHILLAMD